MLHQVLLFYPYWKYYNNIINDLTMSSKIIVHCNPLPFACILQLF